jgi:DNA mismatch repair protein MutL
MARIKQLDPHVADLIAAGEVVERPASVVKELVENAIDAGGTQITVEIQNGGMSLIRVTDNGSGIPQDDAETAFLRHATSKLQTARDLEAIETLGFRGEALAAIAAVSRIEILTRTTDAPLGIALLLEAGKVYDKEETGCPLGTTMVVRDLFFNTPARLKFMKRDSAEGAAVFAMIQRIALSHPEVSVKFLRDGKQELLTPGDSKISSAMYSVLGRDIAIGLTEVKATGDEGSVLGFVSMPVCCRGTRGYQHFILNGRPIRSRLLTAALEEAYQNQKMVGKFPGCVLHLQMKPSTVDVNVHPAKTEVKFLNEKKVFDTVYYSVLSALEAEGRHPVFQMEQTKPKAPPPAFDRTMETLPFQDSMAAPKLVASALVEPNPAPRLVPPENPVVGPTTIRNPLQGNGEPLKTETQLTIPRMVEETKRPHPSVEGISQEKEKEMPEPQAKLTPWRFSGEVLSTYIVVEQGDTIYLIDKHAAHERMNFDRMKAGDFRPMSQTLLEPLVVTLPPEEGTALLQQLPLLEEFGFEAENFGGGALVVRQIPSDLDPGEAESTLEELAKSLLSGNRITPASARDHLLHTLACKAAIKGGQKNATEELLVVAQAVLSGEVKYCPHGRPVAITLTRLQLERQFGRA